MNRLAESPHCWARVFAWLGWACLFFLGMASAVFAGNLPFEKFSVGSVSTQEISNISWASHPDAKRFATRLREAIGQKPDFAGQYRIVTWGAGTMAQTTALVDARGGKVYFAPFTSMLGVDHRPNSRLLIENPPTEVSAYVKDSGEPKPRWLETVFWEWDEDLKTFRRLPRKR